MPRAEQDIETLKATYERLCQERDRLRDARGFFARGLGPAPASAGIATGVVAALGEGQNPGAILSALGVLGIMVVLSIWYGGKPAYRHLYAKKISAGRPLTAEDSLPTDPPSGADEPGDFLPIADWYREMIRRERETYGSLRVKNSYPPPWMPVNDLQDGADLERMGALSVQGLWVVVISLLVVATVV
jgi:hypothetical protein